MFFQTNKGIKWSYYRSSHEGSFPLERNQLNSSSSESKTALQSLLFQFLSCGFLKATETQALWMNMHTWVNGGLHITIILIKFFYMKLDLKCMVECITYCNLNLINSFMNHAITEIIKSRTTCFVPHNSTYNQGRISQQCVCLHPAIACPLRVERLVLVA